MENMIFIDNNPPANPISNEENIVVYLTLLEIIILLYRKMCFNEMKYS